MMYNATFLQKCAERIYSLRRARSELDLARNTRRAIRVVCVSDTHNYKPVLPEGDLLIHAGDLSEKGTFKEIQDQLDWLKKQPHRHKVVIAGNHDLLLDPEFVSDVKLYASPLTPQFGTWAYQYPPVRDVYKNVLPLDTEILVTHGPPMLYMDRVKERHAGCPHLLREVHRVRPRLHIYGHIHPGHGMEKVRFDELQRRYDVIRLGQGSAWHFWRMAVALVAERLSGSKQCQRVTTLVNAAVGNDSDGAGHSGPIVVNI
ncbi:hypothetical protein KVT40_003666 [Elsinoe batatas]|uniref:Calcineurin-like phosphoesterase domain-containing protein n=1 Tax=Elsinoe batatas TaxID=2601811 RepID=A0A8K0PHT9_9PEZI|nr:hypothetical protein KVT40_003666 [Elsinoe batatas]